MNITACYYAYEDEQNGVIQYKGEGEVNKRLKDKRNEKRLTQEELAKLTRISTRTYQYYEHEKREPGAYAAIRIAKALDSSVEQLFDPDQETA
jgi:putative transcriptional regulator